MIKYRGPTAYLSYKAFVLQPICPTARLSHSSFVLQFFCPTAHLPYSPFVLQPKIFALQPVCPTAQSLSYSLFVLEPICLTASLSYSPFVLQLISSTSFMMLNIFKCSCLYLPSCQNPQLGLPWQHWQVWNLTENDQIYSHIFCHILGVWQPGKANFLTSTQFPYCIECALAQQNVKITSKNLSYHSVLLWLIVTDSIAFSKMVCSNDC